MGKYISVLLASADTLYTDCVKDYLRTRDEIGIVNVAHDGDETYRLVIEENPDVVVMDIFMPKRDGISVMGKISTLLNFKKPVFIALSATVNGRIIDLAYQAGAEHVLVKPQSNEAIYDAIKRFFCGVTRENCTTVPNQNTIREEDIELLVTEFVDKLGVPVHIKGYQYVRTAIMMVVENPELLNYITKQLYPVIAKMYSTTSSRVERAIRHSIEIACSKNINGEDEFFKYIFGNMNKRPTNAEFLALVADRIRLQIK